MFITVFESQAHTVRQGNRLGASPERLSDLLTDRQPCGGATGSSSPWLSIPSFFLPQPSTPRPWTLSFCGCLATGAKSRSPSRPRRAAGTQPRAPGPGALELAEAGIDLGRRGGDWRRPGFRGGPRSLWGRSYGADRPLIGEGGTRGRAPLVVERGRGSGRRDEELEEAGREMSAAAGSRERESAGPAGGGTLGWGSGAVAGQTLGRAGSVGWLADARGKDQGPVPTEAETLGLRCCGDVNYS